MIAIYFRINIYSFQIQDGTIWKRHERVDYSGFSYCLPSSEVSKTLNLTFHNLA